MSKRWFGIIVLVAFVLFQNAAKGGGSPSVSNAPQVLLSGDYPDPTILHDGVHFYLTTSPVDYMPGFLIWQSEDMLHWKPITRAMASLPGSWAPDLVKVKDRYYIYFPARGWNWVTTAPKITGPWSEPVRLELRRIDPGHVIGEDGRRYLFTSGGYRVRLSDNGLRVEGSVEEVYHGWSFPKTWKTECFCLESPKLFRRGEYFYLMSAEGGTAGPATSHMAVLARSKSVDGPWENSPYNPVVHTYDDSELWWSKGHGTVIEDNQSRWWIVYHAYHKSQYTLGRQVLRQQLTWTPDGWPIISDYQSRKPFTSGSLDLPLSDTFKTGRLGLQWTMWRDFGGFSIKKGALRVRAKGTSPADGRLLLTTARDSSYIVEVEAEVTRALGGLILFYNDRAYAGVAANAKTIITYRDGLETGTTPNRWGRHLHLKVLNRSDRCVLQVSRDGRTWKTLASDVDVSPLNHNVYKGFLALRPALLAAGSGTVSYKNFDYSPEHRLRGGRATTMTSAGEDAHTADCSFRSAGRFSDCKLNEFRTVQVH